MRTKVLSLALAASLMFESGWAQIPEAESLWERALRASDAGRFLEAGEALEKAAELFLEMGDKNSAEQLMGDAIDAYLKEEGEQRSPARVRAIELLEYLAESQWSSGDKTGSVESLFIRTEILLGEKRYQEAERSCTLAYEQSRRLPPDSPLVYRVSKEMAMVLDILRRWDQAAVLYQKSIEAAASVAPEEIPDMQQTLGAIYQLQGRPEMSETFFREAIAGFEKFKNREGWSKASFELAQKLGHDGRAKEALEIWNLLGEKAVPASLAAEAKFRSALTLEEMGEFSRAFDVLTEIHESVNPGPNRIRIDSLRVRFLAQAGRIEEAEKLLSDDCFPHDLLRAKTASDADLRKLSELYYERYIEAHNGPDKLKAQNSFAVELMRWGEYPRSQRVLEETLAAEQPMSIGQRADLEANLAECYLKQGDFERALEQFLSAEKIYPAGTNPEGFATLLNNVSACYSKLGNLAESLNKLERAAELTDTLPGNPTIRPTISNALGQTYVQLGRYEEGIAHYRQALAQHRFTADKLGQRTVLYNLGAAQVLAGQSEAGYRDLLEASNLADKAKDLELEAQIFLFLAARRNPRYWESALNRLETITVELHDKSIRSRLLNQKAAFELHRKQYEKAEELARHSLALYQPQSIAEEVLEARLTLFDIAEAREDFKGIQELAPRLITDLEAKVWGLSSRQARGLVKGTGRFLSRYSRILLENNLLADAFAVEEKRRSLGLTALTRDLSLSGKKVDSALVRERDSLAKLLREARENPEGSAANNIDSLLNSYRGVLDKLERQHLASGLVSKLSSTDLPSIQAALEPGEVLVEFITFTDKVQALAIDKLSIRLLDLGPREELDKAAEIAYRSARRIARLKQVEAGHEDLGGKLLEPILAAFPESSKLVIIPSEGLFSVPFAALRVNGEWVIDRLEITLAASASSWLVSRKTQSLGQGMLLACLGDYSGLGGALTPLPGTEDEAVHLKGLFPDSRLLLGKELLERDVKTLASDKARVHLATHGLFDADEPLLSSLQFSDREVTAADIFGWDLKADLAVLSACESVGFSKENSYLGLSSAFQFAGARNLVASYWPVSDEAASLWMKNFYAGLATGDTPSKAQQRAHMATRRAFPHPYFWAAFAVWGDGLEG